MYKVIRPFNDIEDNRHHYNAGDLFPRKGMVVNKSRISQLLGSSNFVGEPIIEEVKEVVEKVEEKEPTQEKTKRRSNARRNS